VRGAAYCRGVAGVDRKRAYFTLMGVCLALFVLAWAVVRSISLPVAVGMMVVAAVIPPVAVVVANFGVLTGRRPLDFDEGPDPGPPADRG
jgi:hypothetical protein